MILNLTDKNFAGTALRRAAITTCLAVVIVVTSGHMRPALADSDAYRIGPGDTLLVTAYGDAGLSGQFVVGPSGEIGFPLIGDFHATGLTTGEIGARLNSQIGRYVTGRSVSVAIAAYAPVFIIGDVEKQGQYAYHPGMIPLELVAASGGVRRGKDAIDGAQVQLVAARQEYGDLALQVFSNQVRRARFTAEMNGSQFSYSLGNDLDPSEHEIRQRLVDAESALFQVRRSNLLAQKAALKNQGQSFHEELDALGQRQSLHDGEVQLLEKDVAATKSLVERSLTAQSTLREVQRQLSAARRDSLELGSYLARAKQGEQDMAQRADALEENLRAEAANGISGIDLDTIRKQKQMTALLDRMAAISTSADVLRVNEVKARLNYVIVRPANGKFEEIEADEFAVLKPRDILRATLIVPQSPSAPKVTEVN